MHQSEQMLVQAGIGAVIAGLILLQIWLKTKWSRQKHPSGSVYAKRWLLMWIVQILLMMQRYMYVDDASEDTD